MSATADRERADLALIVVNYRNAKMAVRAIADAQRSAGALTLQLIVVDVEPTSEGRRLLRARLAHAQVVELAVNPGFAASCNVGLQRARARHLLVLGSDAFALGDAVGALVCHLDSHPDVGLVAPLLLNVDGSPQDNVFRRFPNLLTLFIDFCTPLAFLVRGRMIDPYHVPRRRLVKPGPIAHANGSVLAVRAEAAAATGPLDSGYRLYLEDTEWQRRMADVGWARWVLPSARFTHVGGASSSGFALANPFYLQSVCRYYRHPRAALRVIALAAAIARCCAWLALRVGFEGERMRALERGFGELRELLRGQRSGELTGIR
jgi:hypothetical protein